MTSTPSETRTRRSVGRTVVSVLAAVGLVTALSACSAPSTASDSDAERTESFDFSGDELRVDNDYADVDVEHGDPNTVTIREYRTVIGTSAEEPEWALTDDTLDLGRPCASTVGVCQISYRITVPEGTTVTPTQTVDGES
ncbi:hypothetical protein [Microbacterium sp.]|uniref:hypothetical protein n=1 Tax=Microbacterium sp. TaxID=51671 RepID=UPI003F9BA4DB